jgi:hypothetical protein
MVLLSRPKRLPAGLARDSLALAALVACVSACSHRDSEQKATPLVAKPLAPAPSVSAPPTPVEPPRLAGRYRLEALLGLNPEGVAKNGAQRLYVLDSLRGAVESGFLVSGRITWSLSQSTLGIRVEVLVRSVDGGYVWHTCEGSGSAAWRGQVLTVPAEIRARARAGVFTKTHVFVAPCAATVPAGDYELQPGDSELVLGRRDGGAWLGYLLVRDEGLLDVEQEAKRLAGYEG